MWAVFTPNYRYNKIKSGLMSTYTQKNEIPVAPCRATSRNNDGIFSIVLRYVAQCRATGFSFFMWVNTPLIGIGM
jgi:hypothetical protein